MHHPFQWLHEYERARVEPALRAKSDLILSGHIHRPSITVEERPDSNTVVIPAGSSYDRRDPQGDPSYANAYNFVSIDLGTGKGTIYLRRWDGQNSRWAPDYSTSKDGRFAFNLPRLKATKAGRGSITKVSLVERQSAAAVTYRLRLLESCDLLEMANLPSDHLVAPRELKLSQLFIPTKVVVELAVWQTPRTAKRVRKIVWPPGKLNEARELPRVEIGPDASFAGRT